jgi:hypothetical protein
MNNLWMADEWVGYGGVTDGWWIKDGWMVEE